MRGVEKRSRLVFLVLLGSPLLWGCAGVPRQLGAEELVRIREQPRIAVLVHQPPPPFRQHGKSWADGMVIYGPVAYAMPRGAADTAASSAGERVQGEIGLEDPAFQVKDRFLAGLTADLNIEPSSVQEPFDAGDEEGFRRAVEAFDLLLEFRTTNWGMGTATLVGKNRYGIGYLGQARLTSVRERKVLWQSGCIASPREEKPATLDELTRDDGALLKERLAGAAEVCTEELLSQFWGKSGRR